MHGYGKKIFPNGTVQEGLYEKGDYEVKEAYEISEYDPSDLIGQMIKWDVYVRGTEFILNEKEPTRQHRQGLKAEQSYQ